MVRPEDQEGTAPRGWNVTSSDVAAKAGVSQSAVSRTFSPNGSVSARTRAKVEAAAAELGYTPNALPMIMRSGRSSIVAVVVGGLYNPFFVLALDLIAERLGAMGNQIMLVRAPDDRELDSIVDDIARYRVDAVVSALPIASEKAARKMESYRIPIINLNSEISGGWLRSIVSDNHLGGRMAADLLKARGCERPFYLAGPKSPPQDARQRGFLDTLNAEVRLGGFDYDDGHQAVADLWDAGERPDGIFCVNDLAACGAMDALRDRGVRVPDDVAVIGYDNIPMAGWGSYRLTTLDQVLDTLIAGIVDLLAHEPPSARLVVPPQLVQRHTA